MEIKKLASYEDSLQFIKTASDEDIAIIKEELPKFKEAIKGAFMQHLLYKYAMKEQENADRLPERQR